MAVWKHRLIISDFFHDDSLSLSEKTDKLTERIKRSRWLEGLFYKDELEDLLEELKDAVETGDENDWNQVWDLIYDVFDSERVWVQTR